MQIGKELKKLRLELGLSQTEMVGDILTKSYYSKIERGLHEINAKDLIEILERNRVNISDFFQGIESKGKSKKYLEQLRNAQVNMFTTVFIGNAGTRIIDGKLVTKRGYQIE